MNMCKGGKGKYSLAIAASQAALWRTIQNINVEPETETERHNLGCLGNKKSFSSEQLGFDTRFYTSSDVRLKQTPHWYWLFHR
jgi:hypothetical protein